MKCSIPEISWHNREPVLSVAIHPINEKFYRLATSGGDCHVVIWQLELCENGAVKVEALSELTRHQKAVNVVRWSPSGQFLASADDDANIIIWQLKTDNIPLLEGETGDKETWNVYKIMRGHKEDIYDVCWSPSGLKLLSGSIDNTAILWDITKGNSEHIITDHKGFVQGTSWDPKGQYFATISTDRICRIFDSTGKHVRSRILKGLLPVPEAHHLHNKEVKYFHDDTFKSFFRRLDFSPDGTLLATPSGHVDTEDCKKILNAAYIFAVNQWNRPVAVLPTGRQCSTVVRFCPILFELQDKGPDPTVALPYRMIVAVGTEHDVILYDTQQLTPFAYFRDIHYTRLTDLTWSSDGLILIASSTDGFCALITFEPDELGITYVKEESEAEESVLNISGCEEIEPEKEAVIQPAKPKKPSLLDKWISTPKKTTGQGAGKKGNTSKAVDETQSTVKRVDQKKNIKEDANKKGSQAQKPDAPKRIKPIPVVETKTETVVLSKQVAKPIAVRRKPREPESNESKAQPQKSGSLLNFLTPSAKAKAESKKSAITAPAVVMDEIEARDAWKNGEKENKSTAEKIDTVDLVSDEETTGEQITLHLDDSCSQTNPDVVPAVVQEKKPVVEVAEKKEEKVEDVEKMEEEIKQTIPKRRIPLITLSSPKRKRTEK